MDKGATAWCLMACLADAYTVAVQYEGTDLINGPHLMACSYEPPSQELAESPKAHDAYLELFSLSNDALCFVFEVEGHWCIQGPDKKGF